MPVAVPSFHPWGASHQAALVVVGVVFVLMFLAAFTRFKTLAERLLGSVLLSLYPAGLLVHASCGSLAAQTAVPMQYCDVAAIAGGLALWTRSRFWCEVVYFFGIAGTLQGLITPALLHEFPDPRFFHFFIMHGGVPVTAIYVVTAMGMQPRPGAVPRVFGFSLAWYAVTALVNLALGTNFAFQCAKPPQASLFDHLGPLPWHNVSAMVLGLIVYTLLYLPFAFRRVERAGFSGPA
ncbi:MAG: TIGR02206 family membrane protein [Verrucomicrobiaceae bacterium]|nr:TIGR02206 family membrane protein [Verrucomicrobiaceae bacterium]